MGNDMSKGWAGVARFLIADVYPGATSPWYPGRRLRGFGIADLSFYIWGH